MERAFSMRVTPKMAKAIRTELELTQEEFAQRIGSSLGSVSRWENGKNKPGKMASKLLELMAKEAGINGN